LERIVAECPEHPDLADLVDAIADLKPGRRTAND
jgi:hypothetical protein